MSVHFICLWLSVSSNSRGSFIPDLGRRIIIVSIVPNIFNSANCDLFEKQNNQTNAEVSATTLPNLTRQDAITYEMVLFSPCKRQYRWYSVKSFLNASQIRTKQQIGIGDVNNKKILPC